MQKNMSGIRIQTDTLTPGMRRMARALNTRGRQDLLEAMATELHATTIEAFQSPADRPAPWPAKKDGSPSNLVGNPPVLRPSLQVEANSREGRVETDRVYAAAHQFGIPDRNLPARPFFPFVDGNITSAARDRVRSVASDKLRSLIGR